jgi:hypothetical protein
VKLPSFKRQQKSGESMMLTDVVELQIPVERPCIALVKSDVDVLISRGLLEAIWERAQELRREDDNPEKKAANKNDEDKHLERLRGGRATDP